MNKYVNSETTFHLMNLLQMGANVQVVSGKMVYVSFELEQNIVVAYVYHINKNNKYFLERMKPYPLPIKELESPSAVIDYIKEDINLYKNAVKSKNMDIFISTATCLHDNTKALEDLFLNHNVSEQFIKQVNDNIRDMGDKITTYSSGLNKIILEESSKQN